MDVQPRHRPQGPEVGVLPDMLIGIVGIRSYASREIMNILDVIGGKRQLAERTEIQPLVWGIHQAAVIQIEGVHVDVEGHPANRQRARAALSGGPATQPPKWLGGYTLKYKAKSPRGQPSSYLSQQALS